MSRLTQVRLGIDNHYWSLFWLESGSADHLTSLLLCRFSRLLGAAAQSLAGSFADATPAIAASVHLVAGVSSGRPAASPSGLVSAALVQSAGIALAGQWIST